MEAGFLTEWEERNELGGGNGQEEAKVVGCVWGCTLLETERERSLDSDEGKFGVRDLSVTRNAA